MKIRTGFVSNSSSSSFVIASDEPITEELLLKTLGVSEGHPLQGFLTKACEGLYEETELYEDFDALKEDMCVTEEELPQWLIDKKDKYLALTSVDYESPWEKVFPVKTESLIIADLWE